MGCKSSKLWGSSRQRRSLPKDQTVTTVVPDDAPAHSSYLDNGFRQNSSVSSTNGASNNRIFRQMKSYEKACQEIPDIKSLDETLRLGAQETIIAIATDASSRTISLTSLRKAADYVFDTEEVAVKRILESNEDICKHSELKELVDDYFDSSAQTLKFCLELKRCVMNACNRQLMSIKLAIKRFAEEDEMDEDNHSSDGNGLDKFHKTIAELRRFTELGEPFTVEFLQVFQSVRVQQQSMLDKLTARSNNLSKKLKSMKSWKKVSGIIFASTFAVALISSVVAAALSAPAAVVALAGAATTAFGPLGKWFQSIWKRYEDPLRTERDIVDEMKEGARTAIEELKNIGILVDRVTDDVQSLLETANFALRYNDAIRIGIEDIQQKVIEFEEWLTVLKDRAETCAKEVREARTAVCQKFKNYHE